MLLNVSKLEKKIMCRFEEEKVIERKYVLCVIKGAYWISSNIAIAILNFSLLLLFSYRSSNFALAKLLLLIPLLHFLYIF